MECSGKDGDRNNGRVEVRELELLMGQNIIVGLKEKCRERIVNGLRSFIAYDNYSAVEVGHLRRGLHECMHQCGSH